MGHGCHDCGSPNGCECPCIKCGSEDHRTWNCYGHDFSYPVVPQKTEEAPKKTPRQLVRQVAEQLYPGIGCSDGGCVFGHSGGMHTNGGCQCLKDQDIVRLRRTIQQLAQVAKALAEGHLYTIGVR